MAEFSVTLNARYPHSVTVHPVGSLDSSTYELLEQKVDEVLANRPEALIFDMEKVDYLSSAGVRVIFKAKKVMKQQGGAMMMVHLQPQIQKVFDILHALPTMQVFASVEELDRYLDKMQKSVKK